MIYSTRWFRLIALLFVLLPNLAACAGQTVVKLSHDMAPLPSAGVPQLHERIAEVVDDAGGLVLRADKPFQWTTLSGEDAAIKVKVSVDAKQFDHGQLTVWNWHNRAVGKQRIEPGKAANIEFQCNGNGVYLVTLDGFNGEACRSRLIRSVAFTADLNAMRKQWNADAFFLGVCAFPGRYHWKSGGKPTLPAEFNESDARELEASLMARLGFAVVRTDVSMEMGRKPAEQGEVETYRFNFDRMDAAVKAYTSRGFSLALQLMNAPDWAIAEKYADVRSNRWRYPHREQPQRAYVDSLLKRYGQHARFVQVFNEPDQVEFWAGTNEEFVGQFQFSREAIREQMKQVPIVNGGYAFIDQAKSQYFVTQLKGNVDMQAYHSHGNLRELKKDFALMKQLHEQAGYESPRYVNTETGYAAWRLDQERRQAQAVPQKVLYCWANGHKGVLLFCSRMTRGPGRSGRDFGFLDYQFSPRFVYGSVAALSSSLAGATFHSTLIETDSICVYQFTRGKDRIVAAFTVGIPTGITISSNASDAVAMDEMGNTTRVRDSKSITLPLDGFPRYVILSNADNVTVEQSTK